MKKEFIRRYGWTLLGIVAGMVGGYLYWRCGRYGLQRVFGILVL